MHRQVHETTGQQIVAFVTLKGAVEATDDTTEVLREHVACKIGKLARPTTIIFTPDLPKTRSGEDHASLKDVAEKRELGDVTTLADPAIVEEIREKPASGRRRTDRHRRQGAHGPPPCRGSGRGLAGTCNLGGTPGSRGLISAV